MICYLSRLHRHHHIWKTGFNWSEHYFILLHIYIQVHKDNWMLVLTYNFKKFVLRQLYSNVIYELGNRIEDIKEGKKIHVNWIKFRLNKLLIQIK